MRRAPYVEEACAKLRVSAGRRRSQRRGAPCELAVGKRVGLCLGGAVLGDSSGRDRAHTVARDSYYIAIKYRDGLSELSEARNSYFVAIWTDSPPLFFIATQIGAGS